jgi:citrate lyase subunit beta / citryl-CoA lyase
MLAKAAGLGVDELVVDLEDGVAAAEKESARSNLGAASARGTLAVRINGVRTPWWRDDLAAAAHADVIVVPKVESADEVAAVAELLPVDAGLEVQIETARGLVEVERIAAAGAPLEALVFGPGDFAASIGVPVLTIGAGVSEYALARVVAAARASGLQALDGPHARLGDDLGLVLSARRALEHGYDGKWVIHPSQIEPVNRIFTPAPADIGRAKRLLEAAGGAARFEGELVDEASRRLAESLLGRTANAGGKATDVRPKDRPPPAG